MKQKELKKSDVDKAPYLVWNALVEIATSNPEELNDLQSVAYFTFWYDSEIQNGGFYQYFENIFNRYKGKESALISSTLEALKIIGAKKQAEILTQASKQYFSKTRKHPSTVEEFSEFALEAEFDKFDKLYYGCTPDMNNYLEIFLEKYQAEFVTLI